MRKHLVLRIFAALCAAMGILAIVFGVAAIAYTFMTRTVSLQDLLLQNLSFQDGYSVSARMILNTGITLGSLLVGLAGVLLGIGLLAFSATLKVFIDIEENTRATAEKVERMRAALHALIPTPTQL